MNRRVFLVLGVALCAVAPYANAYPTTSPSAQAAAALKSRPPRGWIRHYLPDDRYKIAGNVWKLVTTPNDTVSYPAWAPEMLRRPAGNVIGFNSIEDAVEAGYPPSGRYGAAFPDYIGLGQASPGGSGVNGGGAGGIGGAGSIRARRITLADGVSSAVLPAGWRHLAISQNLGEAGNSAVSVMASPRGNTLIFGFFTVPRNRQSQFEGLLSPRNTVDNAINNDVRVRTNTNIRRTSLGGLRAVTLTRRSQVPGTVLRDPAFFPMTIALRGSKAYFVLLGRAGRGPQIGQTVRSFRAG